MPAVHSCLGKCALKKTKRPMPVGSTLPAVKTASGRQSDDVHNHPKFSLTHQTAPHKMEFTFSNHYLLNAFLLLQTGKHPDNGRRPDGVLLYVLLYVCRRGGSGLN